MRTTRHPQRPCSVHAAVPLCQLILGFVATVAKMCISATSAGEIQVYSAGIRKEKIIGNILFLINIFVKVHQLWWKRPLPVQCLWFLQVCTVWLHVARETLLCCGSHWKWRRQEKGEQDWLYGLELNMLNKIELAWQNNSSQYDQTLNIFVQLCVFLPHGCCGYITKLC